MALATVWPSAGRFLMLVRDREPTAREVSRVKERLPLCIDHLFPAPY